MKPEEIEKFFGITYRTWQNWRNENRTVVDFFSKYPDLIAEFNKDGKIDRLEQFNYIIDPVFEDYVIQNLKRMHKLDRSYFSILFPGSEFITRHIRNLSEEDVVDLTIENAKEKFKIFLSSVTLSKFLDSEKKRKTVLDEIDNKFSKVEIYLILKHPEKFI